jgi:serine/threonine protein kinase
MEARDYGMCSPQTLQVGATKRSNANGQQNNDIQAVELLPASSAEVERGSPHFGGSSGSTSPVFSTAPWQASLPCSLGDLKKLEKLGSGAFGIVTKVEHRRTGQIYALKEIVWNNIQEQGLGTCVEREIDCHLRMDHPKIVKLYQHFHGNGSMYLLLEFAAGGHLYAYMRSQKMLREVEAAFFFADVVGALIHVHGHGIAHRDLKPENVLLFLDRNDARGFPTVKLADFGWSAQFRGSNRQTFCGTMEYLSPEMLLDSGHDHRVDIWACGVLLCEMLTGKSPFKYKSQGELLQRIMDAQVEFDAPLEPGPDSLIRGLLQRQPEDRLTTEEAMRHPWLASAIGTAADDVAGAAVFAGTVGFHDKLDASKTLQRTPPSTSLSQSHVHQASTRFPIDGASTIASLRTREETVTAQEMAELPLDRLCASSPNVPSTPSELVPSVDIRNHSRSNGNEELIACSPGSLSYVGLGAVEVVDEVAPRGRSNSSRARYSSRQLQSPRATITDVALLPRLLHSPPTAVPTSGKLDVNEVSRPRPKPLILDDVSPAESPATLDGVADQQLLGVPSFPKPRGIPKVILSSPLDELAGKLLRQDDVFEGNGTTFGSSEDAQRFGRPFLLQSCLSKADDLHPVCGSLSRTAWLSATRPARSGSLGVLSPQVAPPQPPQPLEQSAWFAAARPARCDSPSDHLSSSSRTLNVSPAAARTRERLPPTSSAPSWRETDTFMAVRAFARQPGEYGEVSLAAELDRALSMLSPGTPPIPEASKDHGASFLVHANICERKRRWSASSSCSVMDPSSDTRSPRSERSLGTDVSLDGGRGGRFSLRMRLP